MPETYDIQLSDWNPDISNLNVEGINEARNIYPTSSGYKTTIQPISAEDMNDLPENSEALSTFSAEFADKSKVNFVAFKDGDGNPTIHIIGKSNNTSVIDDGVLQVPENQRPRFAQFGDNIFCAHGGTLLIYTPTSGKFTEISDAPTSRFITVSENFVITAYITESASDNPLKIQWSDLNNPLEWDPDASGSQAGSQTITGLGEIKNIVGSRQSVNILLDNGIVRGTYVGGSLKWRFETIITAGLGCLVPDSVIDVDSDTYFISYRGFIKYNVSGINSIGQNKIDEYIINNLDVSRLNEVSVVYNEAEDLINWFVPVPNGKQIIHFNTQLNKWGRSDTDMDIIGIFKPVGETLDDLTGRDSDDPNLPNVDSLSWYGGTNDLYIGIRGNEIFTYNGERGVSSFKTHEFKFPYNILVNGIEINGTITDANISVEYRNSLTQPPKTKTRNFNSYDRAGIRASGKYFRFNVASNGGLDATSMRIIYNVSGSR